MGLSLKGVRGPLRYVLVASWSFTVLTTLLIASMQQCMSSSSRQSLSRASIFSCFNRHAQCLNASQLKRAPQPANTILWTPIIKYCDSYVTKNTICVVFGTLAQHALRQLASQVYGGVFFFCFYFSYYTDNIHPCHPFPTTS